MDRFASKSPLPVDPRLAATALQDDFAKLVQIFDRELANGRTDAQSRPNVVEAKEAAERGLKLSKQLADLLVQGDLES